MFYTGTETRASIAAGVVIAACQQVPHALRRRQLAHGSRPGDALSAVASATGAGQ